MKHVWKKATLIPAVAAKDRDASFSGGGGGSPSSQGGTIPKFNDFGNKLYIWIDKGNVINSVKNILISNVLNSRNVDLNGKQHSRHQQFWRIPLSPLDASSRLPRSRDHLFSHSISKATLPQGPDMWYLTFYENKEPIYQTPTPFNSNILTLANCNFVRNCGAKPEPMPQI